MRMAGLPKTWSPAGFARFRRVRCRLLTPSGQAAVRCPDRGWPMRSETRQAMITRHMPLVAFVVSRMSTDNQKTLGLDREDALAYGVEGLSQAVYAFD